MEIGSEITCHYYDSRKKSNLFNTFKNSILSRRDSMLVGEKQHPNHTTPLGVEYW